MGWKNKLGIGDKPLLLQRVQRGLWGARRPQTVYHNTPCPYSNQVTRWQKGETDQGRSLAAEMIPGSFCCKWNPQADLYSSTGVPRGSPSPYYNYLLRSMNAPPGSGICLNNICAAMHTVIFLLNKIKPHIPYYHNSVQVSHSEFMGLRKGHIAMR